MPAMVIDTRTDKGTATFNGIHRASNGTAISGFGGCCSGLERRYTCALNIDIFNMQFSYRGICTFYTDNYCVFYR